MTLNIEKMRDYAVRIFETAKAHGWHEERLSDSSYIGLAITEVCEAINADRKGKTYPVLSGLSFMNDSDFKKFYETNIKDTVETEIADVVIRLIDFAYLKWGVTMDWTCGYDTKPYTNNTFLESATFLIKGVLNSGMMNVVSGIQFCYEWANQLGFNLDEHIECKMRYNEMRPYRHGNKKY